MHRLPLRPLHMRSLCIFPPSTAFKPVSSRNLDSLQSWLDQLRCELCLIKTCHLEVNKRAFNLCSFHLSSSKHPRTPLWRAYLLLWPEWATSGSLVSVTCQRTHAHCRIIVAKQSLLPVYALIMQTSKLCVKHQECALSCPLFLRELLPLTDTQLSCRIGRHISLPPSPWW